MLSGLGAAVRRNEVMESWPPHLWMGEGELERDGAEGDIEALAELGERLDLLRCARLPLVDPPNPLNPVSPAKPW